jgi:hypothetical protein
MPGADRNDEGVVTVSVKKMSNEIMSNGFVTPALQIILGRI